MDYSNKQGEVVEARSIGNHFDRCSWKGSKLKELTTSTPAISRLWARLLASYEEFSTPFLKDAGVPEHVSCTGLKPAATIAICPQ